jgi:hypothetical protein
MEPDADLVQKIQSAGLTIQHERRAAIAEGDGRRAVAAASGRHAVSLSKTIAVAMRFGGLFDFPKHPYKGGSQADHDAQKQQRQARGREHGQHPRCNASGVPARAIQRRGLGVEYAKAAEFVSIGPVLNFI